MIQFTRVYLFGEQDSLTAARFLADCCGKAQRGNRRMDTKFAKSAYWNFLLWGMCSSLSVTLSTIIDATLVGNFVGSSGLAVSNLATPVYLLYALFGLTLGMGSSVLIGGKLGASDVEGANDLFHQVLTAGLVLGLACMVLVLAFRSSLCRFLGAEGELLALTPADFDFEAGTVKISKSYQRLHGEDVITTPKTKKSNRTIKMPNFLCDEMRDYLGMLYGVKKKDRIFTVTKSYLHHEMDRGAKEAGVKRIRIHDLRHSHISLLIDMGFSAVAIADRVGHESIEITYRYAHLFPSKQTEMADKLDFERTGA